MTYKKFNIIGLGELLWDLLPTGEKMLGGTTANFAYIAGQLGDNGIIAGRVGNDANGVEALEWLKKKGVPTDKIQTDEKYPTGTVLVSFNNGQPEYEVIQPVAWDFLELTASWHDLALTADAVCFGTLAQRNAVSRNTIQDFVSLTNPSCLRIFDVNLRQTYYSKEVLEISLNLANIVKMNHEELPIIVEMFDINGTNQIEQTQNFRQRFNLKATCITRGGNGSLLLNEQDFDENVGIKVEIADTIGAGDAFTATMTHGFLNNRDLKKINAEANKIGAYVASKKGAMPDFE
jgi:fructokinase